MIMAGIVDIIEKKRDGGKLSKEQIHFFFEGLIKNSFETYQTTALLMAIYFQGMQDDELITWTHAMMNSGDIMDLSHFNVAKVDKHSTGGVGDKMSLPLAPLLAACDLYVPMISGRGLGHTGGTLDKLESIRGFNTQYDFDGLLTLLEKNGVGMIGQTERLVPADRILYSLRDVTGTVPSIPLIASSIMSKKLVEGTEHLVLDVKVGKGAFMKDLESGRALAQTCIALGEGMGRKVHALLTQMDQPIGRYVGNALEVKESVLLLRGEGPQDSRDLILALAEELLKMTGKDPSLAQQKIDDRSALDCFYRMVEAQGGDLAMVKDLSLLPQASYRKAVTATCSGYIHEVNARKIGDAGVHLGAGRIKASDTVDFGVGIEVLAKVGDHVEKGDILAWVEHDNKGLTKALDCIQHAYKIQNEICAPLPLIYERITSEEVVPYQKYS
jgi:pyrimidine-nucleoside phosphorylase